MNIKIKKVCQQHGLLLAIVFGSYSTDKVHPTSDIDIAVLVENNNVDNLRLIYDFSGIFEKEIDLVIILRKI